MPNWGDDILVDLQKGTPDAAILKKYPQLKNDKDTLEEFKMYSYAVNEKKVPVEKALRTFPAVKTGLAEVNQPAPAPPKPSVIDKTYEQRFAKPVTESTAVVQPKESVEFMDAAVKGDAAREVGRNLMYGDQVRKGREQVAAQKGVPETLLPDQTLSQDAFAAQDQQASISETSPLKVQERKNQLEADRIYETPAGKAFYSFVQPILSTAVGVGSNVLAAAVRMNPINTIFYGKEGKDAIADKIIDVFDVNRAGRENRDDSYLYVKPTQIQGNLINDKKLNTALVIPKLVEGLTNMAMLIFGGEALGGGKAGLMAMSYLTTEEDYRKEGKEAGLTGGQLDAFAQISAGLTSSLEAISPNNPILGKMRKGFLKQAIKDIKDGVGVSQAIKRVTKELGVENVKENLQEGLQFGGDIAVEEAFDATLDSPKFNHDYARVGSEIAETVLLTTLQTTLLMAPGTIKNHNPSNQVKSAMYAASQDLPTFYSMVDKGVADGKIPQEKAREMKDNLGMFSGRVKTLEKLGFGPDQSMRMAWAAYKSGKIAKETKQINDDPALKATIGKEINKDQEDLKSDIQDAAMGIPEVGSEISGIELAEIVKNTPNTGKALIDKVKDNDYRVTEIDLQEKYNTEPAFKKRVDEYEKSKEDPEGLRTPAIINQEGKVLDGKKRLVQQYVNGERTARVFQQLKPAPVTAPAVIMPEDVRRPETVTIGSKEPTVSNMENIEENDPVIMAFNQALELDVPAAEQVATTPADALPMPSGNTSNVATLSDLNITPEDNIVQVIDKMIERGGDQTDALRAIRDIPGIENVKFEVYEAGKNPKIDKYFADRGRNPNAFAGLYFDHKRGLFPELAGTLWINNTDNAYQDITHELMHFVTIDSIMAGRAASVLNSAKYDALRNIYDYLKSVKPVEGGLTNENYGLATFEEFMVESLINPNFRNYLSDIIAKDRAEFDNEVKYKGAYTAERLIGEIMEFFKDLMRLLAGGETSSQAINFDESLIDNAVRIGTELFFSGNNPISQQQAGQVYAMAGVSGPAMAMPSKATVSGLTKAINNAIKNGKTDEQIKQALSKADPNMTPEEQDLLIKEARVISENTVTPPKQTVKATIKAATDTRVKDTVVINELTAIKDRLKSEMKGFIAGRDKGSKDAKAEAKAKAQHMEDIKQQLRDWIYKSAVKAQPATATKAAIKAEPASGLLEEATKRGVFTGEVSGRLFASMIKRLNTVKSPVGLLSYVDYLAKVIENVEYEKDLQIGRDLKGKIKSALRGKDKNVITKEHIKDFARISPSSVEDIKEYNRIAEKILGVAKGIKVVRDSPLITSTDRQVKHLMGLQAVQTFTTANEKFKISNADIQQFIDDQAKYAEQQARERIADLYDNLVAIGVINPNKMTAKEMQAIIDSLNGTADSMRTAEEAWLEKEGKLDALRLALAYQQLDLADHLQNQTLTAAENKIADNIINIDAEKLNPLQLAKLSDAINNIIINDNFSGAQEIGLFREHTDNTQTLIQKIKASGLKTLGNLNNDFTGAIESFASVNLMPEFIFKYSKLAAEVQRLTGISDVFNGHARAKKMMEDAVTEYIKLKDSLGNRDIDNGVNRYRRGVYADVMNSFGGTTEEVKAEFDRRVTWIKQTAERLSKSTIKSEKKEGEILTKVIAELLDGSTSADDVKKKLMAIEKRNIPLVEFWQKKHADREDAVRENAEHLNNTVWESVQNYTRTKMKGVNGQFGVVEKETEDLFKSAFISKTLTQQIAGSKSAKTRQPNLPPKSVLDLDFDNVQSSSYYHTNFDVETSAGIVKMKYFFNSEESMDIFGNAKNNELVYQAVKRSVEYQRGFTPPVEAIVKAATYGANVLQAKGVRIALGSVEQIPKQYASVALSTMINLGTDFHLFGRAWMIKNSNPIFKKYGIGLRGETNAGYNKDVALGIIDKVDLREGVMKSISNMNAIGQKVSDWIMSSLRFSDVSVARTSWLAYYMQDLQRRGRDPNTIDWDTEHQNPDDEAAAYAEQMVSRTQTVNDTSAAGNIYKSKNGAVGLIQKTAMPFSGFTVNQRVRFMNDWQKIIFGGGRAEAARSLAATLAEQALFNWYKVALSATATTYAARGLASLFGFWDDEDEEKAENREEVNITVGETEFTVDAKNKKIVANVFSDFFFSGIGNMPQGKLQQAMNWVYKSYAKETWKDGKENRYPSLYFEPYDQQGKIDLSSWGSLAIAPEKAWQWGSSGMMLLDGRDYYAPGHGGIVGKATGEKTELTTDEKKLYTMINLVDMFALMGLSEGVVSAINNKVRNIADKKMDERYGSEKVMRVMKPGEGSPDRDETDFPEEEE